MITTDDKLNMVKWYRKGWLRMRGLFDTGKTKMYVNRGIGTMRVPIRFFNRPEITLFAIRK